MPYENNKDADPPAHPRNLISTFVDRCLDSILHVHALAKSLLSPSTLANLCIWAGRIESYLVANPVTRLKSKGYIPLLVMGSIASPNITVNIECMNDLHKRLKKGHMTFN